MTDLTRTRVLVAEDDADVLEIVVFKLEQAGFEIVAVTDGVAALAAIEADPPKLAILDIQMPGMTGLEVLRQVRASQTVNDLDVILLTGHTSDSDVNAGFAAGASDYVVKPFSPKDLLQRVKALTEQNHALRQVEARDVSTHQIILGVGRDIRSASNTQQALDVMCASLGAGLRADRVMATTVGAPHEVQLTAQWHEPGLQPVRDFRALPELEETAKKLWLASGFCAADDLLASEPPPALVLPFTGQAGARAGILVPIGVDDRVIGIIYVLMVGEPRAWTPAETDVVQAAAGYVARAIVAAEHRAHKSDYDDRMEKLDRQKSDFLASVSHELRTPLTSISGYVEMLQEQGASNLTAESQQRMLDAIGRNTVRLRCLIEDVMALSRIEGGVSEAEFVRVSTRALVTRVGEELNSLAKGSDIVLEVDAGPEAAIVLGDRVSLVRAAVNIGSNAIKFSKSGGVVTICAELDEDARRVVITCRDHGLGIPAHDVADLYTRFFRASNATEHAIPGIGLGLGIAKEIVEDHHGELRLTSVEGKGTTVVMDLPMYDPSPAVPPAREG